MTTTMLSFAVWRSGFVKRLREDGQDDHLVAGGGDQGGSEFDILSFRMVFVRPQFVNIHGRNVFLAWFVFASLFAASLHPQGGHSDLESPSPELRQPSVTATGDEVQVALSVSPGQPFGHRKQPPKPRP
jgi:hypothetical protein